MQKWVLKIRDGFTVGVLLCAFVASGNEQLLAKADSLYAQKKFTEASRVYAQLYDQGFYSPATLLKLSFVYEGLGETGKALYYLSAYYRLTEDSKAYDKIQTLANAKGVSGFELSEMDRISIWSNNRKEIYMPIMAVVAIFLTALAIYFTKRKNQQGKFVAAFFSLLVVLAGFISTNLVQTPDKAVITAESYFMSGPSAASNVIKLIPEGNQVKLGRELDIWIEAEWNDEVGYLRKNNLLLTR